MPWHLAGWAGRFDDPARSFRTLYAAALPGTALREVLAPLRPDAPAIAALRALYGEWSDAERELGTVSSSELSDRALASGRIDAHAPLVDLTDQAVRSAVGREHAGVLAAFGVPHLDETDLRSRNRRFTQALARALYDSGTAGVVYRSNLDDEVCVAVFEGRGGLSPAGDPPRRLPDIADVVAEVCAELGLTMTA